MLLNKEESQQIAGEVGSLELRINGVHDWKRARGVVVLCHPHPLYGGSLENKVVSTLARCCRDNNWIAVRFNFRGVGASTGSHDDGEGELADLTCVIEWVGQQFQGLPVAVAGFSFGGAIAACYGRDHGAEIAFAVLVSPAIGKYGFEKQDRLDCPLCVIQGESDEVLDPQILYGWVEEACLPSVQLVRLPDTGHFYHGKLVALKEQVNDFLRTL